MSARETCDEVRHHLAPAQRREQGDGQRAQRPRHAAATTETR
jgi:hypothetical protein